MSRKSRLRLAHWKFVQSGRYGAFTEAMTEEHLGYHDLNLIHQSFEARLGRFVDLGDQKPAFDCEILVEGGRL